MSQSCPSACPSCGSADIVSMGSIPPSNVFAGRELKQVLNGGVLWSCKICGSYFRWPRLPKEELDRLYRAGDPNAWDNNSSRGRVDWETAASWLSEELRGESSILDIGCSTGLFLTKILKGKNYRKYGIEINSWASKMAQEKGIHMLGTDIFLETSTAKKRVFSSVVAFDVIEHMENPIFFLKTLYNLLSPGGTIILSSGNTDSRSWRLAKSRYWYCTIPEHITFINDKWCRYAADKLGLKLVRIRHFSHDESGVVKKFRELLLNILYLFVPKVFHILRRVGLGGKCVRVHPELVDHPPGWMSSKDHTLVEFKRI